MLGSVFFRRGQPADLISKKQHEAWSYGRNPAPFSRATVGTISLLSSMPSSALHPFSRKLSLTSSTSLNSFCLRKQKHLYFESFMIFFYLLALISLFILHLLYSALRTLQIKDPSKYFENPESHL